VLQRAQLLRIEDTRRTEPLLLDSLLAHRDAGVRGAAALTAGRFGGSAHRDRLHALAQEPDGAVAARALFALGLRKDTSALAIGTRALAGPAHVATHAAWLLGEIGEPARASILMALADAAHPSEVRGALLLAAARLRPVPAATIVPHVASPDSAVAWRAAYVLARGRSASGVRPLLAAAGSPWSAVREQAARGLSAGVTGDSLRAPAVEALVRLADDREPRVRMNAVRSLATHGRRGAEPVRSALRDGNAGVRLVAAQSLDLVLDSTAAAWSAAMGMDTSFVVQRAVADGAARRGLGLHGAWRGSTDWQHRAAAAELDALGPAQAALGRLAEKVRDGDGAATRMAARALLRGSLRDADVGVRTAALGGLASAATPDDLAAALDSYAQSRGDRDADARLAFWQLADSALRPGAALPAPLAARLAALQRPADPLERTAASRIARFAPWKDETSAPRSMIWYEERAREAVEAPVRHAVIQTDRGSIELALHASEAPLTVHNFLTLAASGYFNGQRFHRVVPNFVVQGGDPRGDGNGGPGYAIRDEINPRRYLRGTLGMALSGPHTGGSQFFITHSPQPHLDGGYTVFGQLVAGGDTLDRIVQGDRIVSITIR